MDHCQAWQAQLSWPESIARTATAKMKEAKEGFTLIKQAAGFHNKGIRDIHNLHFMPCKDETSAVAVTQDPRPKTPSSFSLSKI